MKTTATLGTFILLGQILHAQEAPPTVDVPLFTEAPKIDGRLDEDVWQTATVIDGFRQVNPTPGAPATERTEILIGYDEDNIYIGARCYTADPSTINSVLMERDVLLQNEDSVHIVFDTFNDNKSAFFFGINPVGAQVDALVRGDGDDVNYNWDGVWFSATSRDEEGWVAELAIPVRNLRFAETEEHTWGFNVQRVVIHSREYTLWQSTDSARPLNAIFKISQAGNLSGMKGIRQGRSWDVMPYVLARVDQSDEGDDEDFEVGIDIKKNLTSKLTLDLTYNLDFAETEIDAQQTNLTRFPLFFPEKRDFFLENANNFYFGERPDKNTGIADYIFFFSRRIGLTEDGRQQIPVLGGAKLSGQLGGVNLGLLTLTTEDFTYRDQDGQELFEPQTNYTALRLKKDVLKRSSLGVMFLNKAVKGGPDSSGAGVDWDLGLSKHFKTGGFLAQTERPTGETDWAALADFVWESDAAFVRGSYLDIGEDFDPAMGFFKRTGIREWSSTLFRSLRPEGLGPLILAADFNRVVGQDGELESQNSFFELGIHSKNWAGLYLILYDNIEVLDAPFEIRPGIVIPPGRYEFTNPFIGWQGAPGNAFFPYARLQWGEFYDGNLSTVIFGLRTRAVRGLFTRLFYEHTEVNLPSRDNTDVNQPHDFVVDFVSLNVTYATSPTLAGKAIVEWRKDNNLSANVSVRWTYRPGAAAYLVYNELRDLFGHSGLSGPTDRSLIVKMTFFF